LTGVTRPGSLRWAVKPSFVHYVRVIAGGTCEAVDGAELDADGVFEFPLINASPTVDGSVLSFGGGVRFAAHHGFLDVVLRGLELTVTEGGGALAIAARADRVTIATVEPALPVEGAGLVRWAALTPRLTEAGAEVFGNVYPVGSELAPLDAVVRLDS
jgi:hypothetical protein